MSHKNNQLDEKLLLNFTEDNFKTEYNNYKAQKKDRYNKKDKRVMGEDGILPKTYDSLLENHDYAKFITNRIKNGRYLFKPLREIEISKISGIPFKEAKKAGKTRTLSISPLKDIIVQKIIYQTIEDYCETKFEVIDNLSYGYRKGKAAPDAVRQIQNDIQKGYTYVLDADISKFFDEIPHSQLVAELKNFFGKENKILLKLLKRFIYTYRIETQNYKALTEFHKKKLKRTRREKGIPQGGVLSGIIANIYMYNFDIWVKENLSLKYKLKYVRYADDFVILLRDESHIEECFKKIDDKIKDMGLKLHPLNYPKREIESKATNAINLKDDYLEYVGFKITPKFIRIKNDNLNAFKNKIKELLKKYEIEPSFTLNTLIKKINFKIIGNEAYQDKNICQNCGLPFPKRSWMSYFVNITDVRQLKSLDHWIFREINSSHFKKEKTYIKKAFLKKNNLKSLEIEYYSLKKELKKITERCSCSPSEIKFY